MASVLQSQRNKNLQQFADWYMELAAKIRADLIGRDRLELEALIDDADHMTKTNCGWATYEVAPIVRDAAEIVLQQRKRKEAKP